MKEADKLACLVLSLLFQFHSTVRAHFGAVQMSKAHRKCEDKESEASILFKCRKNGSSLSDTTVFALNSRYMRSVLRQCRHTLLYSANANVEQLLTVLVKLSCVGLKCCNTASNI